jgi:myo-inositol-1(or 4)-monophosphatase
VSPERLLAQVIAAVEEEGRHLAAEAVRPGGPRGERGSAPIDREMEERLRAELQAFVPCAFAAEESGLTPAPEGSSAADKLWLVDPHDGTSDFLKGHRGSAISVALFAGLPDAPRVVLAVVHSPSPPDRGPDTIAWAEGERAVLRNGKPVAWDLSGRRLEAGETFWATASSARRPVTFARAAAPGRHLAMPSVAYRLAKIAAGDGVATASLHNVHEYDIAAGYALVRAAGGVLIDSEGSEITLEGKLERRVSGVFAGAPQAAHQLQRFDWSQLAKEPKR